MTRCLVAISLLMIWAAWPTAPSRAETLYNWGVNLDGNVDYNTMQIWVDLAHRFRRWGNVDQPWMEDTFSQFTDQGVPVDKDFGTIFVNRRDPLGVYSFSYQGTADVRFNGGASIVPGSIQTSGGVTTMSVNVNSHVNTWINFRNTDAANPVSDVHLIAPGYDPDTTQVFQDNFTRRLQPFSTLRFMDWNNTNSSQVVSWADRRLPGEIAQTFDQTHREKGGVAWEYMIALANETGKDAWINVPHLADDDYVRNLARLWRDEYNPAQTLYVEWSNEPWNSSFGQYGNNGHDYLTEGNAASQILRVSQIFHEEFGAQADDRLNIVLGAWSANRFSANRAVQYFADQGLEPGEVIDSLAIAPYMDISNSESYADLDELFAALRQRTDDIQEHAALAEQYGLDLISYEGGQHLVPQSSNTADALLQAAQHDPRMAEAYRQFAENWDANGGGLAMHYTLAGAESQFGYWGLLEGIDQPGSVKWDAVMSLLLPGGDATLEGEVTYDDFLIVRDHWQQSEQWWEQGDFNADNLVDGGDLRILYGNITGLTPEQDLEIHQFAEANGVQIPEPSSLVLGAMALAMGIGLTGKLTRQKCRVQAV